MAASMLAEKVLNACCGDANPFGKKYTNTATTEEKKEEKIHPKFKKTFLNQDMKFELSDWKKLPPKARKACQDLGYTEEKWDNCKAVDVTDKDWSQLSGDEKKNLDVLGWEETAWDTKYEETEWKDLPKLQQKAAKVAGYTEDNWGEDLEALDKDWEDLDKDQKEAMCVFGWTEAKWDGYE